MLRSVEEILESLDSAPNPATLPPDGGAAPTPRSHSNPMTNVLPPTKNTPLFHQFVSLIKSDSVAPFVALDHTLMAETNMAVSVAPWSNPTQ